MDALERIRAFLDAVRHQLWRRHAVRAGLYAAAVLAGLAALLPLLALLVMPAQGRLIGMIGLGLAAVTIAGAVASGMLLPRRRWRSDRNVARFVGAHERPIASDLLSAVELGAGFGRQSRGQVSRELTEAFLAQIASRVADIAPAGLDARGARRALQRAAAGLGLVLLLVAGLAIAVPAQVGEGWRRLASELAPGPFAGASMAVGPLVGDMRITLEFPAYTQRPPQVLSSTSGDFVAMPGTTVTIETWAIEPVTRARLVFGAPAGAAGAAAGPAVPGPAVMEAAGTAAPAAGEGAGTYSPAAGTESLAPNRAPAQPAAPAQPPPPPGAQPEQAAAPAARPGAAGEEVEIPVGADARALRARLTVMQPVVYRFWMENAAGARRVESQPRRIEIDADTAPTVALYAPADELDVTRLERVELAYIAEDDYGIAQVELVWENRGKVERKPLPLAAAAPRRAQSKFLWDLAELTLEPGVPVSYHLEATDNDTVLGPKISRSRSFALRVFSPREQHEQLIARQRELFEKMLGHLGSRLVVADADVHAHRLLGRDAEGLVVEIGTILAALAQDELADAGLRKALESMRGRIGGLTKAANEAAGKLEPGARAAGPRLAAANTRLVTELEDDALVLADWLDRQNMENLLAISDEVKSHQERLRRLFDELERTGSADILSEIEREMRALEQRMGEMAHQRGSLPEDVLDRFMHAEALPGDETQDCMAEVRAKLQAGDAAGAREQMERCMLTLEQAAESMEQSLRELRGERFTEEERRFAQVMSDLGDLADDQKQLARDSEELWERYAARAAELMRDSVDETRRQVTGTLDKLRRRLDQVPEGDLTPFAQEELDIVKARLGDVEAMLRDGDIAESLSMARQAQEGMEIMLEELEAALLDEQGSPWDERTREAAGKLRRAQPLARDLVEELEAHTPSPDEIMSPADRRQLERLRRQQQAAGERAKRLGERVRQLGESLPGEAGKAVAGGLDQAGAQMGRAVERMRRRDPSGARHETRSAAETLERTLEGARGAARRQKAAGEARLRDEPIRIPGAEEYRAPEAFREDILEAMKREQAPDGFAEMVKRYYEELIR